MYASENLPEPALGNQYDDDRVLRSYLARVLPSDVLAAVREPLRALGDLAGGYLFRRSREERLVEPSLTQWNAWGERVDAITLTPLWHEAEKIAATHGVVATAYEPAHGPHARVVQMALAYLFAPSTDTYACPLAMTDGAARTLLDAGNEALVARAVSRLTSRDPSRFWTSGQWMTESTGGSDVGRSETIARLEDGVWRLYGRKWFTSAATSQIAVTLARPEGNPGGGHGLALFYLETRDEHGRLRNIRVNRLKDKLGTRKLPTAELSLEGVPAELVLGTTDGVRNIAPMLNVTRTWNAVTSVAGMRRGLALARDYARKRVAFGATLSKKPLHVDTLAGLQAEMEGAFHLAFFAGELLGRLERGVLDGDGKHLLRLLTPIAKLTTAKQAVAVASEILESFGGAGYVEDTGLPALLRDAQVLSIWEGTTNVLSLDALRAIGKGEPLAVLQETLRRETAAIADPALLEAAKHALDVIARTIASLGSAGDATEANARRSALTLGRATELALLVRHAQWALDHEKDARPRAAALRLRANGIDLVASVDPDESARLADDR